jgi:hypothetical protein
MNNFDDDKENIRRNKKRKLESQWTPTKTSNSTSSCKLPTSPAISAKSSSKSLTSGMSCHNVIPLLTTTSTNTLTSDPTKTSKPTSTSPSPSPTSKSSNSPSTSTSDTNKISTSTTTSPTSKSPKSSIALISNPLRDSISNYIEYFMNFKAASIELTESIKQGFLSEIDGPISKDLANKFKEELRPLIKDKIYNRLPNLYQLLIDEQVNVNNIFG